MAGELRYPDREALVSLLANLSEAGAPNGPAYFQNLVRQADFSNPIKIKGTAGYVGDAKFNARRLIDFALTIGTNPKDKNAALGSIIYPLLPEVGVEDATLIAGLLVSYRLLRSDAVLAELRSRYQIPDRPAAVLDEAVPAVVGPPVDWAKETEAMELQGWFSPDPEWLDVGLLLTAAKRARSVCRVEVESSGATGTGVLIDRDLVLTNYHVMGPGLGVPRAALEANAPSTLLRFGAFTAENSKPADGQVVRLATEKPLVACDVQYDFALLRTDTSIEATTDVSPFAELGPIPNLRDTLYVLQHPEGGPMKVALNANGVTWVDPARVTLQYTTKTAGGSSGSPCFDAAWKLTALHHAGSKAKGEGMLMSSIFEKIRDHLKK